jgi:DNA mismatch repair protein MutS2
MQHNDPDTSHGFSWQPLLEQSLGFDKIKHQFTELCQSQAGAFLASQIQFCDDFDTLKGELQKLQEWLDLKSNGAVLPSIPLEDCSQALQLATLEGAVLQQEQWVHLLTMLRIMEEYDRLFAKIPTELYPVLVSLKKGCSAPLGLYHGMEQVLDTNGQVKDSASKELQSIRKGLIDATVALQRRMEAVLREWKQEGWVEEDQQPTVRTGRWVLPVPSGYKRKVQGFVLDESATGQTAYMEPAALLEVQNDLRTLQLAEQREIQRILKKLTDSLRPNIPTLFAIQQYLAQMDVLHAKGKLALRWKASIPTLTKRTGIHWMQARHPLLETALLQQGKTIVPLDCKLDDSTRFILISGPNAGGKSVALKTIGLLQYMLQCGLAVPAHPDSSVGVYTHILLDIGDSQNLEDDLSTYSSHLRAMQRFLRVAQKGTLILMDEMGSGTAPQLGGAIAEGILHALLKTGCHGVVTTHYDVLKEFAEKHPHCTNAAMRYDIAALKPLFILEVGKPGSSFALEIARNIGLPEDVLHYAGDKVGVSQLEVEQLLVQLEKERKVYEDQNSLLSRKLKYYEQELAFFKDMRQDLKRKQNAILRKAKEEAASILQETNKKIEQTIREIRESQADKLKTKELREQLATVQQSLQTIEEEENGALQEETTEDIKETEWVPGAYVRVKDTGNYARIEQLIGKEAEVSFGQIKSRVKITRLERVSAKEYRDATGIAASTYRKPSIDLVEKMETFKSVIDVRGKRSEEVFKEMHRVMDEALLLGIHELRIVHGKGDGVLRKIVREQAKAYPQVAKIENEHADRGGDGVSIIKLR